MKIFFVGSIPDNDWNRTAEVVEKKIAENELLWQAAAELGAEAAKRGHTIIVGSERQTTIDYYVIHNGLVPVAEANPNETYFVEVWRPNGKSRPFKNNKWSNVRIKYITKEILEKSQDLWLIAHHSAISSADIVIAIGGGTGTERAIFLAHEMGIPVLPIASFEGGAKKGYEEIRSAIAKTDNTSVLNSEWFSDNAKEIINLAEKIGHHSYFLSHSHDELTWCDLVHLALLKNSRTVFRDEDLLHAGVHVPKELEAAIQKAETFILLWSEKSAASKWCQDELKIALLNHNKGGCPRRIVLLLSDSTPIPDEISEFFQIAVESRKEKFTAIKTIVESENK
jgi:predicted Rossmann-fold nucleotide-binding protein